MADIITSTTQMLQECAKVHDSVLVSYSGGKDSLVTLDLCSRTFKRVVCFFMYFVPGLTVEEEVLDVARKHYGVEILYYAHWAVIGALRAGVYAPTTETTDSLPKDYTLNDVYALARQDSGIQLIACGIKKADSEFRRKNMAAFLRKDVLCPLRDWNKLEILAYLSLHKLPVPKSKSGKVESATGVDLSAPALCQLHDNHPDDFQKLLRWFPFADAAVARRDFFGIK